MPIGVTVTTSETPQRIGDGSNTGTLFLVGTTSSGPTGVTSCFSLSDYIAAYGQRDPTGAILYDEVETFFRERGQQAFVASVGATGTDAACVTKLAVFTPDRGPGQVAIPGRPSATIRDGLIAHAKANNRIGLLDLGDTGSAASFVTALATPTDGDYLIPVAGSAIIPGLTPGTTRTVPASAVVAALCARVSATDNDNQWPAGRKWPLRFVTGFTAAYGASSLAGTQVFSDSDLNTLNTAGINVFAARYGVLCLFGFVTAKLQSADLIFWSGGASRERMALVSEAQALGDYYLFDTLDGQGHVITALAGDLQGLIASHWTAGALYGATALEAGSANLGPPVNTPQTLAAGQLNALLDVRVSPDVESVGINIAFTPVTQSV